MTKPTLIPDPNNANRGTQRGEGQLERSLQQYGAGRSILASSDGVILAGNKTYQKAQELGIPIREIESDGKTLFVIKRTDLNYDDPRAKELGIADNRTSELGLEWDADVLQAFMDDGIDLEQFWFEDELAEVLAGGDDEPIEGNTDPDEVPDVPKEPKTKRGDLWQLGRHRLLCGDSTVVTDVERLMDGVKADMVFTDPPWNVAIGKDSNPRHRQREGLENDDLPAGEFRQFLTDFASLMVNVVDGDVYVVLGASEWPTLDSALRECGLHWSATVIWVKDQFVLGRSKYHRRYEPIWYGWRKDGKSSFAGDRTLDDVWEIPRPRVSTEHPTMKPVDLVVRAVQNSSKVRDIVYEPFCGSGSTLMACEQLSRYCYGIEISPAYCDVIIKRWEDYTGETATLITGDTPLS